MNDIVERLRKHAGAAVGHWEDYANTTDSLCGEAADEITILRAQLAIVIEDRARFPDRPDTIGSMINAHYGNLKAKAETAEEHCRRLHMEKTVAIREARLAALEEAAKVADEAAAMRERLYQENGASLNASKAAQALIIAANIRAIQSEDK